MLGFESYHQSRQQGVAGTYVVFDIPTICADSKRK